LLLAIAVGIAPMATSANAQFGFRDDIVNVPGGFVFVGSFDAQTTPSYGNGQADFATRINVVDANGVARLSQMTDFNDLHEFNISFDSARYEENFAAGTLQVLNIVWLGDSQPAMGGKKANAVPVSDEASIDESEGANAVGLAYGLGALGTEQQMRISLRGSIIGDSYWAADVENQVIGPKAGLVWRNRRGPWSLDLQSSILLGFNSGQVDRSSGVGTDHIIPGALNRLLYMTATYSSHTDERQMFTPVGELRAQSRFRLTDALSLRTTWSSLVVGNLLNENGEVHWALPDTTIVVENDNMLIHQLYCGLE
jgi:hypothetical protein